MGFTATILLHRFVIASCQHCPLLATFDLTDARQGAKALEKQKKAGAKHRSMFFFPSETMRCPVLVCQVYFSLSKSPHCKQTCPDFFKSIPGNQRLQTRQEHMALSGKLYSSCQSQGWLAVDGKLSSNMLHPLYNQASTCFYSCYIGFFIVDSNNDQTDAAVAPTLSRGMRRSSEPCFKNTLPEKLTIVLHQRTWTKRGKLTQGSGVILARLRYKY